MPILHLVRTSNFIKDDLSLCLKNLSTLDSLILLDDGCYNIAHPLFNDVLSMLPRENIYVIAKHAEARGLVTTEIVNSIPIQELVLLTFANDTVITWQ